jgi:hypothetical protein
MKSKLITSSVFAGILAMSALFAYCPSAQAQWHHHGGYYRGGGYWSGGNWVAPLVIGGVVGYEINRANQPVIVQQQTPIIVQQPQTIVQNPPPGYHWQEMIDPQTGVHKIVAVPN